MKESEGVRFMPLISISDKSFRDRVGDDVWEKIKSKTFRDDGFKCCGCGYEPYDVDPNEVLDIHIIKDNLENPEESDIETTCKLCHIVEHADIAIKRGYVKLVNSYFKQGEIINICRNKELSHHIENGEIRYIKKPFQEFLEELKTGISKEGKVKFILTDKYLNYVGIC